MSDIETLERIKKREAEAQEELDKAKNDAGALIDKAKRRADESLKNAEAKTKEEYSASMKATGDSAAKNAAKTMEEWKDKTGKLADVSESDAIELFANVVGKEFGV